MTSVFSGRDGTIRTPEIEGDIALRRGTYTGTYTGDKFGYIRGLAASIDIDTPATWVDLWAFGGIRTPPSGTFTLFMASDDAADTNLDIEATYQDTDGVERTVTATTDASDGTTPVSLGVTATECYRAANAAATALAGNLSITSANNFTAGVPDNQNEVLAYIPTGHGQTQQLTGRVPSDKRILLDNLEPRLSRASGADGSASIAFQMRAPGKTFLSKRPIEITNSVADPLNLRAIKLAPGTDYRVRIMDVSDNGTTISGALNFTAVDA